MTDERRKRPLQMEFREFSFPAEDRKPAPEKKPAKPVSLDEGDYFKERGPGDREDFSTRSSKGKKNLWSVEFEELQDRIASAARGLLPDNPVINRAINEASDLDMLRVVGAGVLEQHFRGEVDDDIADGLTAAALLVDAANFNAISYKFSNLTVTAVEEIRMAEDARDQRELLQNLGAMENESKTVFVALQIAELETIQQEIRRGGKPAEKESHEEIGAMIAASADGVNTGLVRRAVSLFNEVGVESNYTTTLKTAPGGKIEVAAEPDVVAHKPKGAAKTPKKKKPAAPKP